MDVVVARCAGLDVGKRELVACVRVPADGARAGTVIGSRRQVIKKFATFTGSLRRLAGWLAGHGVTEVVMEATGQYWKPVWYALEDHGGFELKLVNAQHVRFVPGRKTDVADAAWLAELLEHGLLRGSFVPPAPIRELRDLTRYREKLIQAHTGVPTGQQDPRGRRDQAGLGGLGRPRGLRAGHAGRAAGRGT